MNHVITTYGGGEAFYYIFEGIAALLGSGGFMSNIFRLGGILGVFWVFILIAFRNAYEQAFFWFFWYMVATQVLFLPKATVWIKDPLTFQAPKKVDNVPLALAVMAGTASSIGTALTEKLESVFTLPDYMPYHQTGTVFASRLMMKAHQIKITDPEFKVNMERFVNRCIVFDAMIGHKYTLKDLQRAPDIWELVRSNASPVLGFLYKEPGRNSQGQIVTCRQGAEKLQTLWTQQLQEAAKVYGSGFFRKDARSAQSLFLTALPQSFQVLTKISLEAPKILQQEMMMNAIKNGSQNKLDELRGSVSYAAAKALLQQEVTNRTMGEVAAEVLVIAKAVIEALCYASFIFVMILSLVHNGYRILWNYVGILMWLQMWAPLYAVLNLFMTLYGQYRSSSLLGDSGLTLMTSAGLSQINAQVASMAGWLSCSLPFLAYAIVKGGVSSFMNIAGNIISSAQGAVSSASSEAASGNFSLGNVTMGTQAYQNASAFQRNMAPSYREGHFENVLDDGTVLATQGDGSQVFRGGAGLNTSTLRLKVNSSEHLAQRAEEQMSHQNSVLQAQSEEYATTRMEAARQALTLAQSAGKGQSSQEGYDTSTAFGKGTSISQGLKFSKTLQDQYGFSEKQATDITASLMAGTPKWLGIAADIKGSGSSTAGREKTTQDIQNLANDSGITNSLDESVRSMKDHKFSDSHSQEARMAQDLGHTMEKADHLRSSMSKTQQAIDSYSKVQAFSKTGGFNIDRDTSQELLEFAANQTLQGRRIGQEGAYRLLNTGGYQADALVSAFRDSQWEGIRSKIDSGLAIQSEADVASLYGKASLPGGGGMKGRVDSTLGGVSSDSLHGQADSYGLSHPVSSPARDAYETQQAQVSGEIHKTDTFLSEKETSLQQQTDHSMDRSLIGAAGYNAIEGIPVLGHVPQYFAGSNFKRPSEQDTGISPVSHSSTSQKKPSGSTIKQTDFERSKK